MTLDNETFAARATVEYATLGAALRPAPSKTVLARLGALPIGLPLVVASAQIGASELHALGGGDVFLPCDGWTARFDRAGHGFVGDAVLAAPRAERGLAVKLGANGEIVLVGEKTISLDAETTMASANQDDTATSDVVLDAPLVVRVEVGAVTLTAAEWAALAPGDVVALGRRVNEPVILRIAGTEVARGELVDIEGEVGVRIRERSRTPQ